MGKHTLQLEQWVANCGHMLMAYAFAWVNDCELAHDLVQESFLVALGSQAAIRGQGQILRSVGWPLSTP